RLVRPAAHALAALKHDSNASERRSLTNHLIQTLRFGLRHAAEGHDDRRNVRIHEPPERVVGRPQLSAQEKDPQHPVVGWQSRTIVGFFFLDAELWAPADELRRFMDTDVPPV